MAESKEDTAARYTFIWRSAGLTTNAKTIGEMVIALEDAAEALRLLMEAGVVLDTASVGNDPCRLVTADPAIAQRFGFQREAEEEGARDEMATGNTTDAKAGE